MNTARIAPYLLNISSGIFSHTRVNSGYSPGYGSEHFRSRRIHQQRDRASEGHRQETDNTQLPTGGIDVREPSDPADKKRSTDDDGELGDHFECMSLSEIGHFSQASRNFALLLSRRSITDHFSQGRSLL